MCPVDDELRRDLVARFEADQRALSSLYEAADGHRSGFDRSQAATATPWPFAILEWQPEDQAPALVRGRRSRRYAGTRRSSVDLVASIGWPGRDLVGEDGADAAWLLLQHAGAGVRTLDSPVNRAFRHRCVPLLRDAVAAGLAHPRHLAHTVDGIRSVEGGAPVYAVLSSAFVSDEHGVRLSPDLDVAQIDRSRRLIGLADVSEDLRLRASGRVPGAVGEERLEPWPAAVSKPR